MTCELCHDNKAIGIGVDGKELCRECLIETEVKYMRNEMKKPSLARQIFKVKEIKLPWWKRWFL